MTRKRKRSESPQFQTFTQYTPKYHTFDSRAIPFDTLIIILTYLPWSEIFELCRSADWLHDLFTFISKSGRFYRAREKSFYLQWAEQAKDGRIHTIPDKEGYPRTYLDSIEIPSVSPSDFTMELELTRASWMKRTTTHLQSWIASGLGALQQDILPFTKFTKQYGPHAYLHEDVLLDDPRAFNDRALSCSIIHRNGVAAKYSHPDILASDPELLLHAVQRGLSLRFVSEHLQSDEIILESLARKSSELQYVLPDDRRAEMSLLVACLHSCHEHKGKDCWEFLVHVPGELMTKELIMDIAKFSTSSVFSWCPAKFWEDRDFVLKAVEIGCFHRTFFHIGHESPQECTPLEYCGDEIRDDFEIVMKAVMSYSQHSRKMLRYYPGVPLDQCRRGDYLACASERLRGNKEIVLAAVQCDYRALTCASEKLQKDPDCLAAQEEAKKHFQVTEDVRGVESDYDDLLSGTWSEFGSFMNGSDGDEEIDIEDII